MEIYTEKKFLEAFSKIYNPQKRSTGQEVLLRMLEKYENRDWYVDIKGGFEEFSQFKKENTLFAYGGITNPPRKISSVQEHFMNNSKCIQTLIFTFNEEDWFEEAESRGALCMSFENYEERIEDIISKCHFKIDLSREFKTWNNFQVCQKLPVNFITINDNYILTEKSGKTMNKNVIQFLKQFLKYKGKPVRVNILTKDFDSLQPGTAEQIREAAEGKYLKLTNALANYQQKVFAISNDYSRKVQFHDRTVITNFLMIDSGIGYNLIDYKTSNSQIVVETIFDHYTYKRWKNHQALLNDYLTYLNNLEVNKFKSIPPLSEESHN